MIKKKGKVADVLWRYSRNRVIKMFILIGLYPSSFFIFLFFLFNKISIGTSTIPGVVLFQIVEHFVTVMGQKSDYR